MAADPAARTIADPAIAIAGAALAVGSTFAGAALAIGSALAHMHHSKSFFAN
jgi:F0F1-type ATP synthase membrane subunit c/vacuolar-type H+-ATPase subunit K